MKLSDDQKQALALNAVFWPAMMIPGLNFVVLGVSAVAVVGGISHVISEGHCDNADEFDAIIDDTIAD